MALRDIQVEYTDKQKGTQPIRFQPICDKWVEYNDRQQCACHLDNVFRNVLVVLIKGLDRKTSFVHNKKRQ